MNQKLFQCATQLNADEITKDLGAFFGSIIGTFNHMIVADIIWLRRFAKHPANFDSLQAILGMEQPPSLDKILSPNLNELKTKREKLDEIILAFSEELTEDNLNTHFDYQNMKGDKFHDRLGYPLQHFFNHQTHHRGQITTLFNQLGVDVGVTDLLVTLRSLNLD